ncbi:MAG: hypothetical protein CMI36_11780 [Owenweeksia sp.]|nr:hypothetical protein [Owenweeksia sp.]MBF99662.1 hypothetical protein [Owenweeksia sp.]HBF18608.1 hypothetical protein [Cryomorphaceae bacterium]
MRGNEFRFVFYYFHGPRDESYIMAKTKNGKAKWLGQLVQFQSRELICTHTINGRFWYVSPSVKGLLGYERDELEGRSPLDFLHPDDQSSYLGLFEDQDHYQEPLEWRFKNSKGHYIWLQTLMQPFTGEDGETMIYSSSRDITAGKQQVEQQIQTLVQMSASVGRQNQQLLEFSYIISHNLRGPVGNLETLANFLQESESRDEQEMIIAKIHESSSSLNHTFEELMQVLKVRHQSEIRMEEVNLKGLIVETLKLFEASIQNHRGSIEVDIPEDMRVETFPVYLKSIAVNLLSNAIKYKDPAKESLRIRIGIQQTANGEDSLFFRDNGLGIDLKRYGDKMFRLHKTFHRNPDARGFGLFMCKNQMEAMGGEIRVNSEVGRGCTFSLVFNPKRKPVHFNMPELF